MMSAEIQYGMYGFIASQLLFAGDELGIFAYLIRNPGSTSCTMGLTRKVHNATVPEYLKPYLETDSPHYFGISGWALPSYGITFSSILTSGAPPLNVETTPAGDGIEGRTFAKERTHSRLVLQLTRGGVVERVTHLLISSPSYSV